jgi:glutamyl-tRNA reductase
MVASAVVDRATPRLLIDLAVPRDIEPAVAELPGVTLLDIDDIQVDHHEFDWPPAHVIAQAESIIDDELRRYRRWQKEQRANGLVGTLRRRAEGIRQREVERALRRLPSLSDEERKRIEAMSRAIVNQLLHEPTTRLKAHADDSELARAIELLFGLSSDETPKSVYLNATTADNSSKSRS